MMTQTLPSHPLSRKETVHGSEESVGGTEMFHYASDGEVDETHPTQVSLFCTLVIFLYSFYIFFVSAFVVVSAMFIKTEGSRPGPMPTNDTNT
ncbi:unnamed protein product [Hydatigera taeniaeformis]|uniref:TMEM132D_N domain-containing protein n=1 Tax=Hydatigena taeniaeformis TaxID=6205 RepID=A0A0R3WIS5_HYDTA|nr:unnamed protein product [Hydatigera taeniaeformis]